MAAYTAGTVKITGGSAKVYGTLTSWITYLGVGDLFKITGENVVYDVAAINTATELTLSSRYARTNLYSAVASNIASPNTVTNTYSGTLGNTPVIPGACVIVASPNGGGERFSDNSAGVLTGENTPAGSGTVDYDSGAWAITFGTALTATLNLTASYNRGVSSSGESYQGVVDFTPNYSIPELSTNDVNFAHIYTKAMRIIDKNIYAASGSFAASTVTASHFHGHVSATFNNMSVINASITNASIGKLNVHASRLKTDNTYDGYDVSATVNAAMAFGETLYTAAGFVLAKANNATSDTMPCVAITVKATGGAAKSRVLLRGQVCDTAWNWSPGIIYQDSTDGDLTQTRPGSTKFVQIVGHALSADTMFFNPNLVMAKVV